MAYNTYEECVNAIKHDGESLKNIPEQFRTSDLCLQAIRQSTAEVLYIPEHLKHLEFYVRAATANTFTICHMPDEVIAQLVEIEGRTLKYLPDFRKSVALCKRACEIHRDAIEFVPTDILLKALRRLPDET